MEFYLNKVTFSLWGWNTETGCNSYSRCFNFLFYYVCRYFAICKAP